LGEAEGFLGIRALIADRTLIEPWCSRDSQHATLTRHSTFRLVAGGSRTRIGHRGRFRPRHGISLRAAIRLTMALRIAGDMRKNPRIVTTLDSTVKKPVCRTSVPPLLLVHTRCQVRQPTSPHALFVRDF
jgi:hypothetical protein